MCKSSPNSKCILYMALVGINTLSYKSSSCRILGFQNKSPELSNARNKIIAAQTFNDHINQLPRLKSNLYLHKLQV